MSEWIKCSERLPEKGEACLAIDRLGNQETVIMYDPKSANYKWALLMGCGCCERINIQEITHWMPLPPPPEVI